MSIHHPNMQHDVTDYSHKALNMPQLTIRIDNLLLRFESLVAPRACHRLQTHVGWNSKISIYGQLVTY